MIRRQRLQEIITRNLHQIALDNERFVSTIIMEYILERNRLLEEEFNKYAGRISHAQVDAYNTIKKIYDDKNMFSKIFKT